MKVITTCQYCNHQETFYVYDKETVMDRKCEKCGDSKKKVEEADSGDKFGYNHGN